MNQIPHTASTSENGTQSVSLFLQGKVYVVFRSGFEADYGELLVALSEGNVAKVTTLVDKYEAARLFAMGIPGLEVVKAADEENFEYKHNGVALSGEMTANIEEVRASNQPERSEGLKKFFELLEQNPSERSREYLHNFLKRHRIVIAPDGCFIGYRGVKYDMTSIHRGRGFVNGKLYESANLDNSVGNHITLEREFVIEDPSQGCSVGLHVGSYEYASSFGERLILVKVNPADVVSVPHENGYAKIRTCAYIVVGSVNNKYDKQQVKRAEDAALNYDARILFVKKPEVSPTNEEVPRMLTLTESIREVMATYNSRKSILNNESRKKLRELLKVDNRRVLQKRDNFTELRNKLKDNKSVYVYDLEKALMKEEASVKPSV